MRLIGAPVVRKMLGIPFGKMGQCASPAKLARHARYPVSPIAAINAWAHIAGYLHESVSVVDVGGRGLGLVAAKGGVTAGEALVSMPLAACVTHDLALATPAVAELLASLPPNELEPHVSMAVWLMHARVHQPLQLRPWLAALPSQFDCTLDWSEKELAELQASRAAARARALRGWASALYGKLLLSLTRTRSRTVSVKPPPAPPPAPAPPRAPTLSRQALLRAHRAALDRARQRERERQLRAVRGALPLGAVRRVVPLLPGCG